VRAKLGPGTTASLTDRAQTGCRPVDGS
jgi:hypothetical protein